jgi:hypothetical protein
VRTPLLCPVAAGWTALRTTARRGSDVEDPSRCEKTWLLHLFNTGDVGVGMVLALLAPLDIRRARAPYRPGTATGGREGDTPLNVCNGCRSGSMHFQAATGEEPTTEQQPRRSARLLAGWCTCCRRPKLEVTLCSLAPLPARLENREGVQRSACQRAQQQA